MHQHRVPSIHRPTPSWLRLATALLLTLALFATACGSDDAIVDGASGAQGSETTTAPTTAPTTGASNGTIATGGGRGIATAGVGISASSWLEVFTECDAYLGHIKGEALARVNAYGLQGAGGGGFFPEPMADEVEDAMDDGGFAAEESASDSVDLAGDAAVSSPAAPAAPANPAGEVAQNASPDAGTNVTADGKVFSGTNVQVTGVDEPDIVKTDGNRIVTLHGNVLDVVDVTGQQPTITTTLQMTTYPQEMLLNGNTILLVGTDWGATDFIFDPARSDIAPPSNGGPVTWVTQVDISGQAVATTTMRAEGNYVSARMIGDVVRLVISSPPPEIGFVFPQREGAEEAAEAANRAIIESSTLEDWLADYSILDGAGNVIATNKLLQCNQMHRPSTFAGFDTLSVVTFNINEGLSLNNATGVLANGSTVYASTNSLYVATTAWDGDLIVSELSSEDVQSYTTSFHQFDLTNPALASYVASGSVQGSLLNQFAMHEWDGRVAVATTRGAPWSITDESESFLTIFEPQGENLNQIGQVGNMGRGERIFSVRFIQDRAYVVTFRQVDPLYVVDFSNPTAPVVTGELKVPGFSTYLHPLGDNLLLGVGQDATDQGRTLGAKLSLFDVSNPTAPSELDTWVLPNANSNVEWDHRAFLWWAPEQMAVLPVTDWQDGFGGAIVATISREGGIVERGRVDNEPDPDVTEVVTQCQVFLPEWAQGLDGDFYEEIQVCGPDQQPGRTGYVCEVDPFGDLPPEQLNDIVQGEFGLTEPVNVPPGGTVAICFPGGNQFEQIVRSIIIGDSLWTVGHTSLQKNSIASLEREARIDLTPSEDFGMVDF